MAERNGVQTSEWWTAMPGAVLTATVATTDGDAIVRAAAVIATAVVVVAYVWSRVRVKGGGA